MSGPVKLSHTRNIELPGDLVDALIEARVAAQAFLSTDLGDHEYTEKERTLMSEACSAYLRAEMIVKLKISEWLRT